MNIKLYIATIIISILLMLPSCLLSPENPWLNLLSGIGCSGIAAAIMSIFIDLANEKRERKRLAKFKKQYFGPLFNELEMFIGRLLWIDEHISDTSINWNLNPNSYYKVEFIPVAGKVTGKTTKLTFGEAKKKVIEISKKYSAENGSQLSKDDMDRIHQMFLILFSGCLNMVNEVGKIYSNEVELVSRGYISLEDITKIRTDISLGVTRLQNTNYSEGINKIFSVYDLIRKIGDFSDSIDIGWSFSVTANEI